ncbi:MAG: hypothetical protein WBC22_07890 [Sedimentisphaerales bacterium]
MKTRTPTPDLEYYMGKLDQEYESRGQEAIGRMLDDCRIPFFYKEPLLVWEDGQRRIRRPDFTLPTYNNTVIEYTPAKDRLAEQDKSVYRENNIAASFLDESDLTAPNWQQRLYDKLEEIYHRPLTHSTGRYR